MLARLRACFPRWPMLGLGACLLIGAPAQWTSAGGDHSHDGHHAMAAGGGFTRNVVRYQPPDVALIDSSGEPLSFRAALEAEDSPVFFQFIYTTCPGVCPVLSAIMSDLRHALGPGEGAVRLWSVTIDPDHDTPERLGAYAAGFGPVRQWRLMTGGRQDVDALRKAFHAYQDNKMDHEPLTFVWPGQGEDWLRLYGFPSAEELLAEYRRFAAHARH